VPTGLRCRRSKPALILVVEDEPDVLALAVSIIEELGHATLSAANAPEALALLEDGATPGQLFTDINLPDGPGALDGLGLARRAVEFCPGLKVVYTSGGAKIDRMIVWFVEDAIYLPKPYTPTQLIDALKAERRSRDHR
jgi:two-component system, response regulator PdtaR